jgi:hypothetical protein
MDWSACPERFLHIRYGTDSAKCPMTSGPAKISQTTFPALDQQAWGMGLALLAYSLLAVQDATVKWLVVTLPVWQVLLFVRSAILVVGYLAGGSVCCAPRAGLADRAAGVHRPGLGLRTWLSRLG